MWYWTIINRKCLSRLVTLCRYENYSVLGSEICIHLHRLNAPCCSDNFFGITSCCVLMACRLERRRGLQSIHVPNIKGEVHRSCTEKRFEGEETLSHCANVVGCVAGTCVYESTCVRACWEKYASYYSKCPLLVSISVNVQYGGCVVPCTLRVPLTRIS